MLYDIVAVHWKKYLVVYIKYLQNKTHEQKTPYVNNGCSMDVVGNVMMRKPSSTTVTPLQQPITPHMPVPSRLSTRSKRASTVIIADPNQPMKRRRTGSGATQLPPIPTKIAPVNCCRCKKKGKAEELISCEWNCGSKIHQTCLPSQFGKPGNVAWECDFCQTCSICKKGFLTASTKLKCYLCLIAFHLKCYDVTAEEKIRMVKEKRFSCELCDISTKKTIAQTTAQSASNRSRRTRTAVPALNSVPEADSSEEVNSSSEGEEFMGFHSVELNKHPTSIRRSKSIEPLRSSEKEPDVVANEDRHNAAAVEDETIIPDASRWSVNEVYEYFKAKFPRHAHVFEDEEIDGEALYFITREDVLMRFKVKVGPTLKIYDHILKMQNAKRQMQ